MDPKVETKSPTKQFDLSGQEGADLSVQLSDEDDEKDSFMDCDEDSQSVVKDEPAQERTSTNICTNDEVSSMSKPIENVLSSGDDKSGAVGEKPGSNTEPYEGETDKKHDTGKDSYNLCEPNKNDKRNNLIQNVKKREDNLHDRSDSCIEDGDEEGLVIDVESPRTVADEMDDSEDAKSSGSSSLAGSSKNVIKQPVGKDSTPLHIKLLKKRKSKVGALELSPQNLETYRVPFKHGWRREVVNRNVVTGKATQCDIYYFPPSGRKLRSMVEIETWLSENGGSPVKIEHFSFVRKPIFGPPQEVVRDAGKSRRNPSGNQDSGLAKSKEISKRALKKKTFMLKEKAYISPALPQSHTKSQGTAAGGAGIEGFRSGPKIKYVPKVKKSGLLVSLLNKPVKPGRILGQSFHKKSRDFSPEWLPSGSDSNSGGEGRHSQIRNVEVIKYSASDQTSSAGNQDEIQNVIGTASKLISSIVNPKPPVTSAQPVPFNVDAASIAAGVIPPGSVKFQIVAKNDPQRKFHIVTKADAKPEDVFAQLGLNTANVKYQVINQKRPLQPKITSSQDIRILNLRGNSDANPRFQRPEMPVLQQRPRSLLQSAVISRQRIILPPPPPLACRPGLSTPKTRHPISASLLSHLNLVPTNANTTPMLIRPPPLHAPVLRPTNSEVAHQQPARVASPVIISNFPPPPKLSSRPYTPQSSVPHTPQSSLTHTPQSSITHTPQSSITHTPQSSITHTPQSLITHTPQSSITHTPQSSITHTPQSSITHTPQTSVTHTPQSSVTYIPQTPVIYTPQSSVTHTPQSSVIHMPQSSVIHMPQSSIIHTPKSSAQQQTLPLVLQPFLPSSSISQSNQSTSEASQQLPVTKTTRSSTPELVDKIFNDLPNFLGLGLTSMTSSNYSAMPSSQASVFPMQNIFPPPLHHNQTNVNLPSRRSDVRRLNDKDTDNEDSVLPISFGDSDGVLRHENGSGVGDENSCSSSGDEPSTDRPEEVNVIPLSRNDTLVFKLVQHNFTAMTRIFEELSVFDLLRASRVCKHWHKLAMTQSLWQRLDIHSVYRNNWEKAVTFFIKVGVTELNIANLPGSEKPHVVDRMVKAISQMSQLKVLQFKSVPQHVMTRIIETMPHLQNFGAEDIIEAEPVTKGVFVWSSYAKEHAIDKAVDAIVTEGRSVREAATIFAVPEAELQHLMLPDSSLVLRKEEDSVLLCCMRLSRMGFCIDQTMVEKLMDEEISKRPSPCQLVPHMKKLICHRLLLQNQHFFKLRLPYQLSDPLHKKLTLYTRHLNKLYKEIGVKKAQSFLAFTMEKFSVLNSAGNRICNVTALSTLSAAKKSLPLMIIFPNIVRHPPNASNLIFVSSKDGLVSQNLVTHYLRACFSEISVRPLLVFFKGEESLFSHQLVSECTASSVHFQCVPPDISDTVFPGSQGGILRSVSTDMKSLIKESDFINLINQKMKTVMGYSDVFKKTGIFPLIKPVVSKDSGENKDRQCDSEDTNWASEDSGEDDMLAAPETGFSTNPTVLLLSDKQDNLQNGGKQNLKSNQPPSSRKVKKGSKHKGKLRISSFLENLDFNKDKDLHASPPKGPEVIGKELSQKRALPQDSNDKEISPTHKKNKVCDDQHASSVSLLDKTIDEVIAQSRREEKDREDNGNGSTGKQDGRPPLKIRKLSQGLVSKNKDCDNQNAEEKSSLSEKMSDLEDEEREEEESSNKDVEKMEDDDFADNETVEEDNSFCQTKEDPEVGPSDLSEEDIVEETKTDEENNVSLETSAVVRENNPDGGSPRMRLKKVKRKRKKKRAQSGSKDEAEKSDNEMGVKRVKAHKKKKKKKRKKKAKEQEQESEEVVAREKSTPKENVEGEEKTMHTVEDENEKKLCFIRRVFQADHDYGRKFDSDSGTEALTEDSILNLKTELEEKQVDESVSISKTQSDNMNESKPLAGTEIKESVTERPDTSDDSSDSSSSSGIDNDNEKASNTSGSSDIDENSGSGDNASDSGGSSSENEDGVSKAKSASPRGLKSSSKDAGNDEHASSESADEEKEDEEEEEGEEDGEEEEADGEEDEEGEEGEVDGEEIEEEEGEEVEEEDEGEEVEEEDEGEEVEEEDEGEEVEEEDEGEEVEEEEGEEIEEEKDAEDGEMEEVEEMEEEGESSDNEEEVEEEENGEDENEGEEDSNCQLCMLSNPPHSKETIIDWVDCDGNCGRWFHVICINRSQSKPNLKHYVCPSCRCKR